MSTPKLYHYMRTHTHTHTRPGARGPLGADDVLPQTGEGPEGIGHLARLEDVHLAARVVRQRRQEVLVVDVGLGKGHGLGRVTMANRWRIYGPFGEYIVS